jgi:hypothetical protein
MRSVVTLALLVALAVPASAADQKTIDAAVKKAGAYLKSAHAPRAGYDGGQYKAGTAALAGLGMLQAGLKADDESVRNVTNFLREVSLAQTDTYHTALCVLYFDRLGDAADIPLIQMLGLRLYAGMTSAGGWTYKTWEEIPAAEVSRLQQVLRVKESTGKPAATKTDKTTGKDDGFLKPAEGAERAAVRLHTEVAKTLRAVQDVLRARGRAFTGTSGGDNSNTQFGIIGLWVASRYGLPAKDAFALIEGRFLSTQAQDGGWSYSPEGRALPGGGSTVAMTCAGLLGLAVSRVAREERKLSATQSDPPAGTADDPFFNPTKGDGDKAAPLVAPQKPSGVVDKSIEAALRAVGSSFGGGRSGAGFAGGGNLLYTWWSIERVAVAYSLDTIGGINWYDLGVEQILPMQGASGSFNDQSYGEDVATAFAILFLTKANFTKDLSSKNKGKDPGKSELRGGGGGAAPLSTASGAKPKGGRGGAEADPPADPRPAGGFSLPTVSQPTEEGEADKIAKSLTAAANDTDFAAKLREARDTKGAKWTKGLVLAAARLDGDKRVKAREALAERLVRMTARTLREMMRDPESELRRAACLAAAMKDEKEFIADLIDRITDPSDFVVRAARAGLVSFAGTDYGPKPGADDAAKVKAATAWTKWHDGQTTKK